MSLLLPAVMMVLCWAWATGRLRRLDWRRIRSGDVAAILAALLGARLLKNGELLPALVGLGWAGGWLWYRQRGRVRRKTPSATMTTAEARDLLDLPAMADAAAIREAHRRLIVRVHPDAGGSLELARRVNVARDALLAELDRRPRRA